MLDGTETFKSAIAAAGLTPPDDVIADGRIHRFSTNGNPRDESGWYVLHLDGVAAGSFGDWRTGITQTWCSKSDTDMTATEVQAHRDRIKAMQAARDVEQAEHQQHAAHAAETALKAATPAPVDHPYLVKKGIKPHGTMVDETGFLLVPMRDINGKLWNVERINPVNTKDKRGLAGGRRKGLYFTMGKPQGVLIICEGFATGASIHEATGQAVAVAFNAGNLHAVAQGLRAKYPDLKIILAADDDVDTPGNPGMTKATEAAHMVGGFVAVPSFGVDRPDGVTDFNDLHKLVGANAVAACISDARPVAEVAKVAVASEKNSDSGATHDSETEASQTDAAWPVPEQFVRQSDPQPYPLDALPTILRDAVEEVVGFVKAPVALAASSALSALSVAVQGLYDVERAPGLRGPCSLYMLSIAESGERKTTCDGYFKRALEQHQREKTDAMKPYLDDYKADVAVWEAKKSGVLDAIKKATKSGEDTRQFEADMRTLEASKPKPVRVPTLIRGDDTPENLGWALMKEWPSAGVLSSEAGVVFGGHAMGSDSQTRNLALLNVLWDGGSLKVGRRTSESFTIEGARLTMGLLVQEVTLRTFFDKSKGLARGTGFLARFLVAWPLSTMGTRLYSHAPTWKRLDAFTQRLLALLRTEPSIDDDGRLNTVTLSLSHEAHAIWVRFHDEIETMLAPNGELVDVKDVASKVADNAARLACLLHVFDNGAGAVSAHAMASGAKLATWHLTEAQRFLGQFALPPELDKAMRLDHWLLDWCRQKHVSRVSTRDTQQMGPLREKTSLTTALAELVDMGRVRLVSEGKRKLIEVNPILLEVTP